MSKRLTILLFASIALLFVGLIYLFFNTRDKKAEKENDPVTEVMTFVEGMNYAMPVPLPDSATFAGEPVPMDIFYVREQFDRELTVNTYWHSSTLLSIKRAARWFPVIGPILKKNNIPDDFKYLALIESGLMNVVSPSGAAGYWQFLDKTGKEYGLEVNKEVDERYHVAKATEAACAYLNKSYNKFGNWTLVAASYNAGQGRIDETIEKQQVRNYYHMFLNDETSRYIFRILAMKYIYESPVAYGFKLAQGDVYNPLEVKTIKVTSTIHDLPAFARQQNTTYRMLKELNPWLRSDKLTVRNGEEYVISLP
ncbi:MAG: lytic transglycosylase domain-containing protein [Bacteroidales bacterium]|nr:lytic transglycosylase domain-containing protein [Bacteroidales bacterium]